MQKSFWWCQCSDRYIISPPTPNPRPPPYRLPPFSPSLINPMVSVDIKHHVYLLTCRYLFPFLPTDIERSVMYLRPASVSVTLFVCFSACLPAHLCLSLHPSTPFRPAPLSLLFSILSLFQLKEYHVATQCIEGQTNITTTYFVEGRITITPPL